MTAITAPLNSRSIALNEAATVAFRLLVEAERVIHTIEGDDDHEEDRLRVLQERIHDSCHTLFSLLGLQWNEWPGGPGSAGHA